MAHNQTPIQTSIPVRIPAQVPTLPPIRFPTPAPTPASARSPAPVRTPAPVRASKQARESLPNSASPVVQPSSSRRASSLSKGPTLAQKQESSTHIPAEGIQDPLPVHTASSTLGPTPGPISALQFLTTQLKEDPTLGRLPTLSPSSKLHLHQGGPLHQRELPSQQNFDSCDLLLSGSPDP